MGRRRIKRISTIILRENSKFLATSMHVWFDEKDSREEKDSYIIVIRYLVESWEEEEADHGARGKVEVFEADTVAGACLPLPNGIILG